MIFPPIVTRGLALALWGLALGAGPAIEPLAPPVPQAPPRPATPPASGLGEDEEVERQLEEKRRRRRRRDAESEEPRPTPAETRDKALLEEALKPRPRAFLLELALVGGTVLTSGERSGYTVDPTVHVNAFYRFDAARAAGRIRPWAGFRVAPFSGTGFHGKDPGNYGLTYFGPMIGLGRLEPVPEDRAAPGRPALGSDRETSFPSVSGFALSFGLAAATSAGRREVEQQGKKAKDDFGAKGVLFDAPGAWAELRYLKVHYGSLGLDWLAGVQTGRGKTFFYAGVGLGAWH